MMVGSVTSFADDKPIAPSLDLTGSIQIQAIKALWDNAPVGGNRNNLDDFWGRINFGAKYTTPEFSSTINIRAFPEGWGYEVLSGLAVKDSTDTIHLAQSKSAIARFMIEQAWVKYTITKLIGNFDMSLRVGRSYTSTSRSLHFGNYVDQNGGGSFQGKLAYHNALDFSFVNGPVTSSVLFGATDKNLNTGYLRLYEKYAVVDSTFMLGVGYRANIFDGAYDSRAAIQSRFSFTGEFTMRQGVKPYFEVGVIDTSKTQNQTVFITPVQLGIAIPVSTYLNTLIIEAEIQSGRTVKDRDGNFQNASLQWNVYIDKKVGSRTRFQAGFFTDPNGSSASAVEFACRFTGSLK